jgi:hypothetical protein
MFAAQQARTLATRCWPHCIHAFEIRFAFAECQLAEAQALFAKEL